MKQLLAPYLSSLADDCTFDEVEQQLDLVGAQSLDNLLWSEDGYQPFVWATVAHNGRNIFLKYTVLEDDIRSVYNQINDPVYRDSCVEFFISIHDDVNYYNLEFNMAGTCSIGYGPERNNRQELPADDIRKISTQTKLYRLNKQFNYCWDLVMVIPGSVFVHHPGIDLSGLRCRVNFYKCGDDLPRPHFLSWNNIDAEQPNFHLPEFFGEACFMKEGECGGS